MRCLRKLGTEEKQNFRNLAISFDVFFWSQHRVYSPDVVLAQALTMLGLQLLLLVSVSFQKFEHLAQAAQSQVPSGYPSYP